jgi:chromatin segregation and condensation protein Rec8/ScpA/Scc1 (kleisin family)
LPDVALEELLMSMAEVLRRGDMFESHQVSREALSTRERMSDVLERLKGGGLCRSSSCSPPKKAPGGGGDLYGDP